MVPTVKRSAGGAWGSSESTDPSLSELESSSEDWTFFEDLEIEIVAGLLRANLDSRPERATTSGS